MARNWFVHVLKCACTLLNHDARRSAQHVGGIPGDPNSTKNCGISTKGGKINSMSSARLVCGRPDCKVNDRLQKKGAGLILDPLQTASWLAADRPPADHQIYFQRRRGDWIPRRIAGWVPTPFWPG